MRRFGRYRVERKLAEGGTAVVWLCRTERDEAVVVKAMRRELRGSGEEAFAREARFGRHLDHPNVARLLDAGEAGGVPYLVQEHVDGPCLARVLTRQRSRGAFDLRFGCRIVADVALALDHVWNAVDDRGAPLHIVHADVSPPNVLVGRAGRAKLIDFGIAVGAREQAPDGPRRGRILYLAPEVLLRGEHSHQSDLYSLGLVLYALCVGRPAWSGAHEVADRLAGRLEPPSRRRPGFPRELEEIVLALLQVDPARRPGSGRALAVDLQAWLYANGGPMSDRAVGAEVDALFPLGREEWAEAGEIEIAWEPDPPPRWIPAAWAVAGVAAAGALSIGILAAVGLAWIVAPGAEAPPRSEVAATAGPEVLLDRAERAVREDLGEAERLIAELAERELAPELAGRRDRLRAELQVRIAVRGARELLDDDPVLAMHRAMELDALYPGHPQVADLLTDARVAAESARAAE